MHARALAREHRRVHEQSCVFVCAHSNTPNGFCMMTTTCLPRISAFIAGHHPNFFVIKNVHPGSIIVDFEIHSDPSGRSRAPLDLADNLARQVHDSGSVLRRGQITKFVFRVLSAGVPTSWALQQTPQNSFPTDSAFPTDSKSRTQPANGENGELDCKSIDAKSNNITPRVIPTQSPPARMLDSSMTAGVSLVIAWSVWSVDAVNHHCL